MGGHGGNGTLCLGEKGGQQTSAAFPAVRTVRDCSRLPQLDRLSLSVIGAVCVCVFECALRALNPLHRSTARALRLAISLSLSLLPLD